MIIWKKKLIECCKCHKKYSFDDNLFYHLKKYILICPNCNLSHEINIKLLKEKHDELKKINKLNLTAIDIGSAATNRQYAVSSAEKTAVNKGNPANASGTITNVEIYLEGSANNCEFATFYLVSGNNLSTRDSSGNLGTLGAGYHSIEVSIEVEEGDYIGFNADSCQLSMDTSGGSGLWYQTGDFIPCTNQGFTLGATWIGSLYGTGTTEAEEKDNAILFGTAF